MRNFRIDTASLPGGYKSPQELPETQNKNGSHYHIYSNIDIIVFCVMCSFFCIKSIVLY